MHTQYEDAQTADAALHSKISRLQAELEKAKAAHSQSAQELLILGERSAVHSPEANGVLP